MGLHRHCAVGAFLISFGQISLEFVIQKKAYNKTGFGACSTKPLTFIKLLSLMTKQPSLLYIVVILWVNFFIFHRWPWMNQYASTKSIAVCRFKSMQFQAWKPIVDCRVERTNPIESQRGRFAPRNITKHRWVFRTTHTPSMCTQTFQHDRVSFISKETIFTRMNLKITK